MRRTLQLALVVALIGFIAVIVMAVTDGRQKDKQIHRLETELTGTEAEYRFLEKLYEARGEELKEARWAKYEQ